MGTPAEAFRTMKRCWAMTLSLCIVQDVQKFELVVDRIIEAQGCLVKDENLRSGRRGDAANNDLALAAAGAVTYTKLKGEGE